MTTSISDTGLSFSDTSAAPQQFSIGAYVAGSALTVTLNPSTISFRSATLGNGGVTTLQNAAQLSLTIPSGATLGTTNAVAARFVLAVANNSGTPVLMVSNMSGGLQLDGSNLVSPTTISSGATSASVWYSASSVAASSTYQVVGFVDTTQATAGAYVTAPSLVQGGSIATLGSMSSIGYGQTWQNFTTGQRPYGTTYYNTTGKPILVNVMAFGASGAYINMTSNGSVICSSGTTSGTNVYASLTAIIPDRASYLVTATIGAANAWRELR